MTKKVGMSERSFIRHYSRLTGISPARAVERMRVEVAREMLSTTDPPVNSVEQRCGFGSEETIRRCTASGFVRAQVNTPEWDECVSRPRWDLPPVARLFEQALLLGSFGTVFGDHLGA